MIRIRIEGKHTIEYCSNKNFKTIEIDKITGVEDSIDNELKHLMSLAEENYKCSRCSSVINEEIEKVYCEDCIDLFKEELEELKNENEELKEKLRRGEYV